jgi:hypothetical protein
VVYETSDSIEKKKIKNVVFLDIKEFLSTVYLRAFTNR